MNPTTTPLLTLDGAKNMTDLDRLIAMLEPGADENTVLHVRHQLEKMVHGAYTNDYVPRMKLDDEVFAPAETSVQKRSQQQSVEPFDEWLPNDPRNW